MLDHIDGIASPGLGLGADQILELCESDIFLESRQNSEVASSSNCCYEDINKYNTTIDNEANPVYTSNGAATSTSTENNNNNNHLSIIFDDEDPLENDISQLDFTSSPLSFSLPHHHQYIDQSNNQEPLNNINQLSLTNLMPPPPPPRLTGVIPMMGPQITTGYDQDEFGLPSYRSTTSAPSSCSLMDPLIGQYLPSSSTIPFSLENCGINFTMLGNDISNQDLDFQGDNMFFPDTMQRVFHCSSELQGLSSESHLLHGGASSAPLASEITSLDDPTFKVGKLSVEERKRKIHRYMKKRNERNFSKKIKYACRKTLADSRPRVRGRFAKNDELGVGEIGRSNIEYEIDNNEEMSQYPKHHHQANMVVKEEDDISSAIFGHLNGVNSFHQNYPIQSWI